MTAAATQALRMSGRRWWLSSMMAAKNTAVRQRKPVTAIYIGPVPRSAITVSDRIPPIMNRTRRTVSGAVAREILRPKSAQRPMSPAMKTS